MMNRSPTEAERRAIVLIREGLLNVKDRTDERKVRHRWALRELGDTPANVLIREGYLQEHDIENEERIASRMAIRTTIGQMTVRGMKERERDD